MRHGRVPFPTVAAALLAAGLATAPAAPAQAQAQPQSGSGAKAGGKVVQKKRHAPGVRGMFDAAQELYDAGKYPEALAAYAAILRKYPAYEPAAIQIAKTLYRMDRTKEAFAAFSRINPQHLDAETSYEYGWTFYTNKTWEGALYAFQRVPIGHALYDLANYYGGLCAIKLKRYDDAADMLEKAVVLPDKLSKSRALYVKHVQALRLMQQKSALAKERDKERESLAEGNRKRPKKDDPGKDKDKDKDKDKPASTAYEHQGFKGVERSAKVKFTTEHQYFDNNGLNESTYDAKVSNFDLLSGLVLPLPLKNGKVDGKADGKDRQAAFGLQIGLGAEDRITHGTQQRQLQDESSEDLTRQLNKDLGTTDVQLGKVSAEAWLELPLPENAWLAGGGAIEFFYTGFQRGKRTGDRKGYGDLNGKSGPLTYGSEASYTEILNTKTQPITTVTEGFVFLSGEVATKLTLRAQVTYDMYDYLTNQLSAADVAAGLYLDGPDTMLGAELKATEELPFGFRLSLQGGLQQETNYIVHGLPTYGDLAADGQVATAKASIAVTPPALPFLTVSVSQQVSKTDWQLANAGTRDVWDVNVPNYLEDFVAWASLNLAF